MWTMLRMHMHPEIRRFVSEPYHAVDKFHFFKNHKGAWCDAMVNPFMLPSLDGVNTEICEQSFKFINRYQYLLRHQKKERFAEMLLNIVEGNHKMFAQKLMKHRKRKQATDEEAQ
ncbi:hypothetical protein DUNSADRAFT_485 [Dunaliella salina]|uniref:Uncharacterized protein n=1 Tax=Dunaliella salina TaxID=3046 RepID=A0ABQ7FYV5_DUNSA|nr:hypothetical protein DUNSADRAFT_485 [Dunaliella salina]|eukprot:KAF5827538.1 hypothetical protein DUNSADRAFT_485 [Dunaliella salina]